MLYTILLVLLILMLLGFMPQTGWHNYGYMPSGSAGLILLIVLIVLLCRG